MNTDPAGLKSAETELNYFRRTSDGIVEDFIYPDKPRRLVNAELDKHTVRIYDARPVSKELSLDTAGFQLATHAFKGNVDFLVAEQIVDTYYPELEELAKETTGAIEAVAMTHNVRRLDAGLKRWGEQGAAREVHADGNAAFTRAQRVAHFEELLSKKGENPAMIRDKRFAEIHIWRPLIGPVLQDPLGMCDVRSTMPQDYLLTSLVYPEKTFLYCSIAFNPAHRWFYFPAMTKDECLFIKCYDSLKQGVARFTPHSAFSDPSAAANAQARFSIEVRLLLIFPDRRN